MKNPNAQALGSIKTKKKAESSRKNGLNQRPHIIKTKHFLSVYPYQLENNEWKFKFPLSFKTKTGRVATYNPDFYCPTTGYYVELTTSTPNICEQGYRWADALRLGLKLKVFWWEGQDVTKCFKVKKGQAIKRVVIENLKRITTP